jgi:hypothetical protein
LIAAFWKGGFAKNRLTAFPDSLDILAASEWIFGITAVAKFAKKMEEF